MFVLVDKYEPEGPMARILKFLVLLVSSVAIMHKLQPYGLGCFSRRKCRGIPGVPRSHSAPSP